ncbi:hypothetical protein BCV70DRAFT_199074 [Testicularia cyperi]|uniref:Secreted protein n=1 Tax=Testicularia cyperi TaxID=1882483 RepID=A0A317XUQ6_9BASI|nr:hypothetical protein BCV70DRAFT_199074 [Testicularia cyperi]
MVVLACIVVGFSSTVSATAMLSNSAIYLYTHSGTNERRDPEVGSRNLHETQSTHITLTTACIRYPVLSLCP